MVAFSSEARETLFGRFRVYDTNPRQAAYELFADPLSPSGRLELGEDQAEVILAALHGEDVTWRAGHGVGKSTTLATLVLLFLLLRPHSIVPTTAPTFRQVRNLWAEIRKWHERFHFRSWFAALSTELRMVASPDTWRAVGVASNKPQNVEGLHAPPGRMLFLVDEAKGVMDAIYDSIDGACSNGGVRIYCSTPGSRHGKFYDSHHGRIAKFFRRFHSNGETCPRVGRAWVAQKREEWGQRSPIYIAKVRGDFPSEGDDVMFPLDLVDAANDAFDEVVVDADGVESVAIPHGPKYALGCDVSRFGFNQTVSMGGSIRRLDRIEAWERIDTVATAARLQALAREWPAAVGRELSVIAVDDTGVGGGVTDQLRRDGAPVEGVIFGGAASDASEADGMKYFANQKAEMAHNLRRALEGNFQARQAGQPGTFALLRHSRLQGQLTSLRRRYVNRGVLVLVDPDDPSIPASELAPGMKVSPDHAHAALLTYYAASTAVALTTGAVLSPDPSTRANYGRYRRAIFGTR
jgi:hypothetical protein